MFERNQIFRYFLFCCIGVVLLYTRFVGLDWGFPYPMHPDERNMVVAILGMTCNSNFSLDCLNPHFYAYGQLPLFLAYGMTLLKQYIAHRQEINFIDVTLSLRIISAVASIMTSIILYKTIRLLSSKHTVRDLIIWPFIIFCPAFIQSSHFGTTESLLMLYISLLLYGSILYLQRTLSLKTYILFMGVTLGFALGTKVSSVVFGFIPLFTVMLGDFGEDTGRSKAYLLRLFFSIVHIGLIALFICMITSPFTLIDWKEFLGSMQYESSVALGTYKAFYTRQFEYALPVVFPFIKVFPYTLGIPLCILFILGFIFLPWNKTTLLLRMVYLALFLPNAWLYAKWSRFYAPVFPVMAIIGIWTFFQITKLRFAHTWIRIFAIGLQAGIMIVAVLPGVAYLSIYEQPDVRFIASKWIYETLPASSPILSETANVVDIPMPNLLSDAHADLLSDLHPISFDFYEVDHNAELEEDLSRNIKKAEYIFVPSRRIFWNHTCSMQDNNYELRMTNYAFLLSGYEKDRCMRLASDYPLLQAYYADLFSGKLGYTQVAEFSSYPHISFFGQTLFEIQDESAEETWTAFDHPVVRIYKKIHLPVRQ